MARRKKDTEQITFRLERKYLRLADDVAKVLSRPGIEASRTDALRAAIAVGLEQLRKAKT